MYVTIYRNASGTLRFQASLTGMDVPHPGEAVIERIDCFAYLFETGGFPNVRRAEAICAQNVRGPNGATEEFWLFAAAFATGYLHRARADNSALCESP